MEIDLWISPSLPSLFLIDTSKNHYDQSTITAGHMENVVCFPVIPCFTHDTMHIQSNNGCHSNPNYGGQSVAFEFQGTWGKLLWGCILVAVLWSVWLKRKGWVFQDKSAMSKEFAIKACWSWVVSSVLVMKEFVSISANKSLELLCHNVVASVINADGLYHIHSQILSVVAQEHFFNSFWNNNR